MPRVMILSAAVLLASLTVLFIAGAQRPSRSFEPWIHVLEGNTYRSYHQWKRHDRCRDCSAIAGEYELHTESLVEPRSNDTSRSEQHEQQVAQRKEWYG